MSRGGIGGSPPLRPPRPAPPAPGGRPPGAAAGGRRLVGHIALAVLGLLVGGAGSLVHAAWFPGGLLLALAGTGALCWGGALATGGRTGAAVAAGGWLLAVILLTLSRPEGDFLFAAGAGSYLFLFGGMLTAVLAALLPRPGGY